ncbi:GNAT family N-acetyltransferase [Leptolyngbya sp. 15MV]|nr:GNAT family N-acetyltransferase [Leptolyngbya sp. 15MV]
MIDDLDRIMAVMEAAFEPRWGEAWNRRQVMDSLTLPHVHYRLVDASGGLPEGHSDAAGFILTRHVADEEELLLVAVRPELRGRGIGAGLLELFKNDARRRGATRVFLEMRHNNPALSLYRSAGFVPLGHRPDYYRLDDGSRLDAITLGCDLASN